MILKIADYFPEYDSTSVPQRMYFWNILSTLDQKLAERFIDHSIKKIEKTKAT